MIVQLMWMLMRMLMQHPIHRRVVLLESGGRGRATAGVVVCRRDDRCVPGMRRRHTRGLMWTPMVHALIRRGRRGRSGQRLHVQTRIRLMGMMMRMVGSMVHAHRGRPGIITGLQAHPGISRRETRRMGKSIGRRRR